MIPFDPFAFLGTFWLIFGILIIVFYVVGILIAIWVYRDAKDRDMNETVWLLIVLLTGCIGCIIYLIVRKD